MIQAGVIGWPIEHSKSPIIHRHWLNKYGIDGSYEKIAIPPAEFDAGIADLISRGFAGANVTIPHKESALRIADVTTDRAAQIGAANTLTFKDGKIHADNTDCEGFINNITSDARYWNAGSGPALVLGAGGAAKGVLYALLEAGVPEIFLINRTREKAERIANQFGRKVHVANWEDGPEIVGSVSTLVNTTALGMVGQPKLEFDLSGLAPATLVTDIVYTPLETDLLAKAKANGCKTVDGLGMLLHQAVTGFESWFGVRPMVDQDLRQKVLNA